MTDRPIIFSAPMVRALLDGRNTQARRLTTSPLRQCAVGDRLWVRESFFVMSDDYGWEDYASRQGCQPDRTIGYRADQDDGPMIDDCDWEPPRNAKREVHGLAGEDDTEAWTLIGDIPSIYMPRWASRLTLIVEAVRVEPLQAISEADALAEGVDRIRFPEVGDWGWPQRKYRDLWNSLHGADSWDANPEVVALTFRVVRGNIDRIEG
jgi:hypothetical protein